MRLCRPWAASRAAPHQSNSGGHLSSPPFREQPPRSPDPCSPTRFHFSFSIAGTLRHPPDHDSGRRSGDSSGSSDVPTLSLQLIASSYASRVLTLTSRRYEDICAGPTAAAVAHKLPPSSLCGKIIVLTSPYSSVATEASSLSQALVSRRLRWRDCSVAGIRPPRP